MNVFVTCVQSRLAEVSDGDHQIPFSLFQLHRHYLLDIVYRVFDCVDYHLHRHPDLYLDSWGYNFGLNCGSFGL